jgi:hypothetical protein
VGIRPPGTGQEIVAMLASIPTLAKVASAVLVILLFYIGMQFWKRLGRARSIDRAGDESLGSILRRLESVVSLLGGSMVEGPALQTPKGRLALLATRAPQEPAIDVTKFTVALSSPFAVTVIPSADAAKALQTKTLRAVELADPAIAAAYKVLASDADFGRRIATPDLVGRLQALDRSVQARARLQVALHGATVLVERDLERPEELKAFHDGSVSVIEEFRRLAGG